MSRNIETRLRKLEEQRAPVQETRMVWGSDPAAKAECRRLEAEGYHVINVMWASRRNGEPMPSHLAGNGGEL